MIYLLVPMIGKMMIAARRPPFQYLMWRLQWDDAGTLYMYLHKQTAKFKCIDIKNLCWFFDNCHLYIPWKLLAFINKKKQIHASSLQLQKTYVAWNKCKQLVLLFEYHIQYYLKVMVSQRDTLKMWQAHLIRICLMIVR